MTKTVKVILIVGIGIWLAAAAYTFGYIYSEDATVGAMQEEVCQYDNRYNADGTCDNSDPACPETLKEDGGNCNSNVTEPAPTPVQPSKPNVTKPKSQCEK